MNNRLPSIIKALKLGEKPEHEKTVIYLSPDEIVSQVSEGEVIDFEVTPQ